MKRLLLALVWFVGLSCASVNAYVIQSGSFQGTNVGGLDTLIGQTTGLKNSGVATETKWVNSLLNPDTNYVLKTETVQYFSTESDNIFAFQLRSDPGYFLIKNAKWWALYQNNASSDWGVIDLSELNAGFRLSDIEGATISHVTEFGSYVEVPEPSSLILLCLGLFGLIYFRRRYRS